MKIWASVTHIRRSGPAASASPEGTPQNPARINAVLEFRNCPDTTPDRAFIDAQHSRDRDREREKETPPNFLTRWMG